ncbi:MAG: hypothetical protein WKF59_15615 [Chitinophagaceae bacterium]
MLAQKHYPEIFKSLKIIAVDEWHELLGSKRGVQVELAVSRLIALNQQHSTFNTQHSTLNVWGISATIGNLGQAKEVLLSPSLRNFGMERGWGEGIITAQIKKKIEIESIFPDEIEKYPWAGHLGIKLVDKVIPIIEQSTTTLIFINTRGMSERWYQEILKCQS